MKSLELNETMMENTDPALNVFGEKSEIMYIFAFSTSKGRINYSGLTTVHS